MVKTNEVEIVFVELIEEKKYPQEVGYYSEKTYKVRDNQGKEYLDKVYNAPWQVGGNSGAVRELIPIN
jgi:hypothetical protein